MRYLDWDVLLFPVEEQGAQVPLKEFKTTCYGEQHDNTAHVTPLLTAFVPSLHKGKPFQISLHSWSETGPMITKTSTKGYTAPLKEIWQVRVIIDGIGVFTEKFPIDTQWPQIISTTTSTEPDQASNKLPFPPFHRALMTQALWQPSDPMGRIRVEISTGYIDPKAHSFFKVINVVNFAFQPAPLDLLEHSGIAWPNPQIFANPIRVRPCFPLHPANSNMGFPVQHKRPASIGGNFTAPGMGMPSPVASSPFKPTIQDTNNYIDNSRSSSAYSTMPVSAGPLMQTAPHPTAFYGGLPNTAHQPMSMRLPSDQFRMILNAINPSTQASVGSNTATTMPPPPLPGQNMLPSLARQNIPAQNISPPLPAQNMVSKGTNFPDTTMPAVQATRPPPNADTTSFTSRRAESSSYSDVSMHPGCTNFPFCTCEDEEGHIVHNPPTAPATVVKGKKEGAAATKPRDFFSTILDTTAPPMSTVTTTATSAKEKSLLSSNPADIQGKKRTRSALKALNLNDGSPEKKGITKLPRKVSKASVSSVSDKENVSDGSAINETVMLDA